MIACTPVDIQIFGSRVCTRCGATLAANADFFPRDSYRVDGLHSWCRACKSERTMEWKRRKKTTSGGTPPTITIGDER